MDIPNPSRPTPLQPQKRSFANVLGPLTTTWIQPSTCTYLLQPRSTLTEFFRGQKCILPPPDSANPLPTGIPEDITSCWPPATRNAAQPTHPFFGWGIYSPGIICPAGYVTACTAVYGNRRARSGGWSTAAMQFDIEEGETALGCCPESYTCGEAGGIGTCTIVVPSTATGTERVTIPTGRCEGAELVGTSLATFPDVLAFSVTVEATQNIIDETTLTDVTVTSTSFTRQVTLYAPMFQLYFKETDLPPGENGGGGTSGGGTSGGVTSGGVASGGGTGVGGTGEGGLSIGAKAGIAVGLGIGVVLLFGIGFCLFMRRRKRKKLGRPGEWKGLLVTSSELPVPGHPYQSVEGQTTPGIISPYTAVSDPSPVDPSMCRTELGTNNPGHGHHQNWPSSGHVPTELAANGEGVTPVELYVPGMEHIVSVDENGRALMGVGRVQKPKTAQTTDTRVERDREKKDTFDSTRYA